MAGELRESSVALPETWPTVEQVAVNGTTLYYRLDTPAPLRDEAGRYRRDERGRIALEAFMALPLATVYGRLAVYLESVSVGDPAVEPDQARLRTAFGEIVEFVERFGPLGIGWSRTYRAENAEADRLAIENGQLRWRVQASADPPQRAVSPLLAPGRSPIWLVVFPEIGLSPFGEVRQVRSFPELAWEARVRLEDNLIAHDRLGTIDDGPLSRTRAVIQETLDLAHALAGRNPHVIRDALDHFSRADRLFWVGSEPYDSMAPNWARAVRGMVPEDGLWQPFKAHRGQVDWETLGWSVLAQHLSRVLTWGALRVGLRGHRPQLGWRVGSLVEVMYLQLLEHVTQHPDFGIGQCDYCGAPILRVRRQQRWHTGCAPAGRQRESRATRKARLTTPPAP
jgi:hypothetical protein